MAAQPPPGPQPSRQPRTPWLEAAGRAVLRQMSTEGFGAPGYSLTLSRPKADGFAAAPRDFRPPDPALGRSFAGGRFIFGGSLLDSPPPGDPWARNTPSRAFAIELHRFAWLPHLMALGDAGGREALRLTLAWRRDFGRWSAFAWSREVLPRRVFNLACAVRRMASVQEGQTPVLADLLARQARHLLRLADEPANISAESSTAIAVAGAALSGKSGDQLLAQALPKLKRALGRTVMSDGCHATRSPEAGLELLLDLLTLDDALLQRGREAPSEVTRAIDRLSLALRALTLGDGRLAAFHGGEASTVDRVAAAAAHEETELAAPPPLVLPDGRYHRLQGQILQLIVDGGPPARGPFGVAACAQPGAIEVICGRDRLIVNSAWSPREPERQGFRLTPAGSTLSLGESSVLTPLTGRLAAILGPRLEGGHVHVTLTRQDGDGATLIELSHDGWKPRFGLMHERSLYLDGRADELRGEERLSPAGGGSARALAAPYAVRFHLHPDVQVSLARDRKSVLLRGPSGRGWWFRSDAPEVAIEASAWFENGAPRRAAQITLRGVARTDALTKVRWKLAPTGGAGDVTGL